MTSGLRTFARNAKRILSYVAGAGFAVLALGLIASALYPQLTAQVVAHAAPDVSIFYNWFASHAHAVGGAGMAMAATPVATMSDRSLTKILDEMKTIQDEHKGKPMPEAIATKFEELAAEAAPLQAKVRQDRDQELRERQMADVAEAAKWRSGSVPAGDTQLDNETPEEKANRERQAKRQVAGYVTLGDAIIASQGLKQYNAAGKPNQQTLLAKVGAILAGRRPGMDALVPLNRVQIAQFKSAMESLVESKAVPDIGGTGDDLVIQPQRLSEVVRVTEQDRLTMRDIMDVQRTTSDSITYMRITSYTRAAAAVAHSASKPQAAIALDKVREAVRTLAVWIPVENQQLDDLPALSGIINNELLYDLAKHVEELVMYGDGTGENFDGILHNTDVLEVGDDGDGGSRITSDDTLIDIARRGITDVRRAGYEPTGIIVDPLDWEDIVLQKGTDSRYVWVVVTENNVQRLWGVPVIETVAAQDFAGNEIEARNLLVGDFRRGCTLFDRQDANVQVGFINDQFIKNQKTILAELRAAFALKRPGAFRKYETQAANES